MLEEVIVKTCQVMLIKISLPSSQYYMSLNVYIAYIYNAYTYFIY